MTAEKIFKGVFHWTGSFLLYLSSTFMVGSLIGTFLFASIGALTHPQIPLLDRMSHGLVDGFLYAGVWATGLAIVLCVMRWHRESEAAKRTELDNQQA